ncbi:MAG: hypothetical protein ABJN84_18025 [Flavobacteriaceae bacterium]
MKIIFRILLLFVMVTYLQSCKRDSKVDVEEEEMISIPTTKIIASNHNLNISILLDLSDRINPEKYPSPAMEFFMRDIGYLESVARSLELHLLNKRVRQIDDRIKVFIDPEPSDQSLNQKINELQVHFTNHDVTKEAILNLPKNYGSISKLIYESAIKDDHYIGSDIWGFFKNKVEDYCIDEGYRNIMVILTDGYMYHKDAKMREGNRTSYLLTKDLNTNVLNKGSWQKRMDEKDFGFIAANKDLSNLEILVLGINPAKGNPYEEDVIRAYWSKWFNEMKVINYEIKQADLPTHMDKIIRDFILKE